MVRIKNINLFLTDFDIYSTTLGGNKFVTGSIVMPVMKTIQMNLQPDEDDKPYIARLKAIILKDFIERTAKNVNFSFLLKATALDPRYKKLKVVDKKEKRDTVFQSLAEEARKHLEVPKDTTRVNEEQEQIMKKRKLGLAWNESEDESEDEGDGDVIKREVRIGWNTNLFVFLRTDLKIVTLAFNDEAQGSRSA